MATENINSSFVDQPPDELVPLNDRLFDGISGLKGKGGSTSKEKAVTVRTKKLHLKALDARYVTHLSNAGHLLLFNH